MSARKLPREFGVVMTCNGVRCSERYQTALVSIRKNRFAASKAGWISGASRTVGGSGRRSDFCPQCAPAERARVKEWKKARAATLKARDAKRKQRIGPPPTTDVACPTCNRQPGERCVVVRRGLRSDGAAVEVRASSRERNPHPERTPASVVTP